MHSAIENSLAAAAFVGHFSIAVWLFNRLHATGWPRKVVKTLEKALLLVALILIVGLADWIVLGRFDPFDSAGLASAKGLWLCYAILCWSAAAAAVPCWLIPKLSAAAPSALVSNDTALVDVAVRLGHRPLHGVETSLLARVPGNEIFRLSIHKKTLRLPHVPPALDGLSIAHLSDLHMTGQLGREFYDVVVEETNALDADVVVITGDILERERCLPWIAPTLGRLRARYGTYFVLGNHEQRLRDAAVLRRALVDAGWTDVGGRCESLSIDNVEVILAGTELPWFGTTPPVPPLGAPHSAFRILLSHTPDQLPFARANGFDLMLAGHTHGGQIRLPYLGALIAPSRYGFRYAGGLYDEPPTLLHVSRGIAGIHPIRLNCPPELALLVLTA
jgi:predicted MPP superfamily phosphohydrolase